MADAEVSSRPRSHQRSKENGELLGNLEGRFDIFLLCDKNLRYQQNLSGRLIAIIELPTNRWPVLVNLQAEIVRAVATAFPGSYMTVEEPKKGGPNHHQNV